LILFVLASVLTVGILADASGYAPAADCPGFSAPDDFGIDPVVPH